MSKPKRKRKNDEQDSLLEQLKQFGVVIIRLIAGFLMLILMGVMLVMVYFSFLYPEIDVSVWIAMSGLFSYLSGYLAFQWSGEDDEADEKPKNDWSDEE